METLRRRYRAGLQNVPVGQAFHAEDANVLPDELWEYELLEAAVVRVHDVERHLDGIEGEALLRRGREHVQVDSRVLVSGKADVAKLTCLTRLHERGIGAFRTEDSMRVLEADDLVMLHEIDAVGLEAAEGLVELLCRLAPGSPVDLRHQERPAPVPITKGLPHPDLAGPVVIVPAVVHEGDARVDCMADDPNAQRFVHVLEAKVPPAEPDGRDLLSGTAERAGRYRASDWMVVHRVCSRIGRRRRE